MKMRIARFLILVLLSELGNNVVCVGSHKAPCTPLTDVQAETDSAKVDGADFAQRPDCGYENFGVDMTYSDTGKVYRDYGFICLPSNYTPTGKPTPLIIFCQGTGERTTADTNPLGNTGIGYFLAKGYAVMDMNGVSFEWCRDMGFPVEGQHFAYKSCAESYAKGYAYVTHKYNVERAVYVVGLSMGGGSSFMIVQRHIVPVKAQVAFCPALSVVKHDYLQPWMKMPQAQTVAGMWGFDNWPTTAPSQQYLLDNYDKIGDWDNLMYGTEGDEADKEAAMSNYRNQAEADAFSRLKKPAYPCPLHIFHCANDALVDIRYSKFMVEMIKNGGGKADITIYPRGGHGSWLVGNGKASDRDINGHAIKTSTSYKACVKFLQKY